MRIVRSLWLATAVGLIAPPAVVMAAEGGRAPASVRIPKEFKYAGSIHAKGPYGVRIEAGSEGPYVVLLGKDGAELFRELAIVQDAKGTVKGTRSAVQVLTRDEHMVRLVIREGDKRYLAYFESTS